jgi:hypothetical protein
VQAPDELTLVYNLDDPSVTGPANASFPGPNNVVQSPTACKAKGDDYNRNPVGTGPYILKSWAAGDRMVLEKNPDYWNKGHPYLDRIILKPLPDAQSRFASHRMRRGLEEDRSPCRQDAVSPVSMSRPTALRMQAGLSGSRRRRLQRGGPSRPATNPYGRSGSRDRCMV